MRRADTLPAGLPGAPIRGRTWGRLVEHLRIPLHRDGYALVVNSGFTAVTGLVYWIIAAKTFSAHSVGLNYALISAMTFLAGVASLNLPNVVVRFLPESGERTLARVIGAYAVATALAACAATIFIVGVGAFSPRLGFLRSDRGLEAWFVFSTLAWCLFTIQDSVLTAVGRAVWVPIENAVFSVLKIGLLIATAATLARYGIFVSWTIAMLVSVAGVNLLIFARLLRAPRRQPGGVVDVRNRAFARYFVADYVCSVSWLAMISLTPLLVTAVGGATINAYWALAFSVAFPLYLIAQNVGTSLMLHSTTDRAVALPEMTRKAAIQSLRILVPAVALLIVLAPYLLSLFGPTYAQRSTVVLRLLAIGALPNLVVMLAVYVARVQRRLGRAVIALGADAAITLGLAPSLIHAMGVAGVGVSWVLGQSIVAAGLLLTWRTSMEAGSDRARRPRPGVTDARRAPIDPPPDHPSSKPGEVHPALGALFGALEEHELRWLLLRMPSSLAAPTGDVDLLVAPEHAAMLLAVAQEQGFASLPGWESVPDLMLVRYDRPSNRWLVLEVATRVSFRAPRSWVLDGAAEQVLSRRQLVNGIPLPAAGDRFWLLLLHCLLDKGRVGSRYRAPLQRLASAGLDSPLGASTCSAAGPAFAPRDFVDAARSGEENRLLGLGDQLETQLRRRRPVDQRVRAMARLSARTARKPLLLRRRRGLSLALLGPNGVGKSTAAAELQRSLPFEVRIVYMGMWKATENRRSRAARAAEIAVRPFRIWWRYLVSQYHQLRGRMVVFDRYVYDALVPPKPPLLAAKRVYFLFLSRALPRPRAAVFLDAPGQVTFGRKPEDLPENLELERHLYRELTKRSLPVERIDATADMRTVQAEIASILWRELTLRWHGRSAEA